MQRGAYLKSVCKHHKRHDTLRFPDGIEARFDSRHSAITGIIKKRKVSVLVKDHR